MFDDGYAFLCKVLFAKQKEQFQIYSRLKSNRHVMFICLVKILLLFNFVNLR